MAQWRAHQSFDLFLLFTLRMLLSLAVLVCTGDVTGMAWLMTGMAKTTPAETAAAMANDLILNTMGSPFYWNGHEPTMGKTVAHTARAVCAIRNISQRLY
jgi:hypothetical protein